jgi:hypothetical protein
MLVKYGAEHNSQLAEIKKKKELTCLKNYGVKNPSQSESIQNKKIVTVLKTRRNQKISN